MLYENVYLKHMGTGHTEGQNNDTGTTAFSGKYEWNSEPRVGGRQPPELISFLISPKGLLELSRERFDWLRRQSVTHTPAV